MTPGIVGKITAIAYGICNLMASATMVLCDVPLKQRQDILLNDKRYEDARRQIVADAIKDIKKLLQKG